MKAGQVSKFFEQVSVWPRSPADMDRVAENIAQFFRASFAILFLNRASGQPSGMERRTLPQGGNDSLNSEENWKSKFGFASSGTGGLGRQSLGEYVRNRFKMGTDPGNTQNASVFELDIPEKIFPGVRRIACTYLLSTQVTPHEAKKVLGSLILGTSGPLTNEQNLLLPIVAQRLVELERLADLESAVHIRNQFLSIASHELKTPLTAIYGVLQLQERMLRLKKEKELFPEQEKHYRFLKMVIGQVERLNEMIDGLLDISRMQNGRFTIEPVETDVDAVLKDSINNRLRVIAQEAGVKIALESAGSLTANVDPVRIEEVINNLIMNAIRFSPEGGVIWVKLAQDGDAFRLTVRDQGLWIPPEDRERIFQPFEKARRTSRMGGMGLGLFISREIALLHGGNVSLVESVPGKGNVFEAYFPCRSSAP